VGELLQRRALSIELPTGLREPASPYTRERLAAVPEIPRPAKV